MNLKSTDIRSWFKGNGWNDKKPALSRENQTFILTQHRIRPSDIKEPVFYKSSPRLLESCCISSSFQTIYRWRWWIMVNHENFIWIILIFFAGSALARRALFFWRGIFQDLPEKWHIWFFQTRLRSHSQRINIIRKSKFHCWLEAGLGPECAQSGIPWTGDQTLPNQFELLCGNHRHRSWTENQCLGRNSWVCRL